MKIRFYIDGFETSRTEFSDIIIDWQKRTDTKKRVEASFNVKEDTLNLYVLDYSKLY